MQVNILILGGGLTGLSAAYHLEKQGQKDYLLVEKETVPGGLCASTYKDGFVYDYSGHLLHLHTAAGKKLVRTLLKNNLVRLERHAFVDTPHGRVPCPFQANLWALSPRVQRACAQGLLNRPTFPAVDTFEQWCLSAFGTGIYEHFFKPYHTKLWGVSPRTLTAQWCKPFVPTPSAREIEKSLTQPSGKKYGYNATFYYPKRGGIGVLAGALTDKISHLRLGASVTQVDLKRKTARINGQTIRFSHLINTLPLPVFISLVKDCPALKTRAKKLAAAPVTVYHLAVKGNVKPFSWIYFPHKDVPFYRVGLQSGFSKYNAPKNTSLFYIELPGLKKPTPTLEKKIWNSLLQKGIIKQADKPVFSAWQQIPYAYALFDQQRTGMVDFLLQALKKQQCYCAGRYGRWEYSFMERSLLEGKALAAQLKKRI